MAGCSSNKGETSSDTGVNNDAEASSSAEPSGSAAPSGAASGGEVTIVFPASLNTNNDVEGMTAEVKEAGAANIVENSDGSVSVVRNVPGIQHHG